MSISTLFRISLRSVTSSLQILAESIFIFLHLPTLEMIFEMIFDEQHSTSSLTSSTYIAPVSYMDSQ